MSRRNTKSHVAVEQHLEERRQYEEWLAKLESGASQVPAQVIDRVRADYRARLDKVTRELARYEKDLETSLAEAEVRRDELLAQRTARAEALAETELRHHVGEFDDARFHEQSAELQVGLAKLAEEIGVTERDIARFEEILGLIAGALPEAPVPPSPSPAAVVPAPIPAARAVEPEFIPASLAPPAQLPPPMEEPSPAEATIPPKAARPVAKPPAEPVAKAPAEPAATAAPPPSPALDELAFLRSVVPAAEPGDDAATAPTVPAPPRPIPAPEAPSPLTKKAAPEQPPKPKTEGPKRPSPRDDRSPRPSNAADETAKSLRCTECGTFNLPTEWYCEKCGAELSAF